jgi:hypothetical protein
MELVIKDLKMFGCDISVNVGDLENSNATATVSIEYIHSGGKTVKTLEVRLGFPPKTVLFYGIHKNGVNTTVTATVRCGTAEKSIKAILKFCDQQTKSTDMT